MKTLIESINALNKNISEAAVEKETVLEGLQEFVDVINEDAETTVESIADAAEKIAEILPDKIGGGGTTVNESYDISEGTLTKGNITLEGDITAHIPDGVTTIGDNAFMDNPILTKVIIPDSVTSIGAQAFKSCYALTSLTLGNSVTSIGVRAFGGCKALTTLSIPDSVTSISNDAFSSCKALTSLTIPDSVTSISNNAFYDCNSLTTLSIPDGVTSIGEFAFKNCNALTSLTIPDSVTRIDKGAFYNCNSLTTVDMTAFDGTTVPTLANSTVFYAQTHAQGFKFLFATQEALNAFASASNWSTYSQYFEVAQA